MTSREYLTQSQSHKRGVGDTAVQGSQHLLTPHELKSEQQSGKVFLL